MPRSTSRHSPRVWAAALAALAALVASPALAARVCVDSYGGGCLASTTCWHYDQHGDWIGTVRIDYEC